MTERKKLTLNKPAAGAPTAEGDRGPRRAPVRGSGTAPANAPPPSKQPKRVKNAPNAQNAATSPPPASVVIALIDPPATATPLAQTVAPVQAMPIEASEGRATSPQNGVNAASAEHRPPAQALPRMALTNLATGKTHVQRVLRAPLVMKVKRTHAPLHLPCLRSAATTMAACACPSS